MSNALNLVDPQSGRSCTKCGEWKTFNLFFNRTKKDGTLGKFSQCKICHSKATIANQKAKPIEHLRRVQAYNRKNPHLKTSYRLKREFGITLEQYNEMFQNQQGKCKICLIHQSKLSKALAVDHCHSTKKVRGLLCSTCNIGIGCLGDSVENINRALEYLKENK